MRTFLSYSHANKVEASLLHGQLAQEDDIAVTWDAIDLQPYASPRSFMESVREHEAVVHLISLPFLKSRNCMRELLSFMKDDTERNHYRQRTVPIIIEDTSSGGIDLFSTTGHLQLVDYWMAAKNELEEQIDSRGKEFGPALEEVRGDLTILRDIAEHIMRFMRMVTENIYTTSYATQKENSFGDVIERLREIGATISGLVEPAHELGPQSFATRLYQPAGRIFRHGDDTPAQYPSSLAIESSPELDKLANLYDSIVVASENDPEQPEFPPFSPRFPATPRYTITVPRLGREIIIKDESHNFTGSHKDRMAWEIVVYYKTIIQDMLSPHAKSLSLPSASIISNGSAALAIQVMLRCYGLPALKVLIDKRTDPRIIKRLARAGCEIFPYDLSTRELDSEEVLELTENPGGFDVTARNLVDPTRRTYYDWLAYEILNCGAKHIFIPVGTGDLYVNILTVLREELIGVTYDKRLAGGMETIEGLELYGATSSDQKTKMDKLYAAYRPTLDEARRVVTEMREKGLCGACSDIYDVRESVVLDALAVARANKIRCDESGIAGLSLLLQLSDEEKIPPDDGKLLVVNTGLLSL